MGMSVRKILTVVMVMVLGAALAGCGGRSGAPGGSINAAFRSHDFGDRAPHAWGRKAPWNYGVHGIDVSRWQGDVNWSQVRRAGASFAFIKATEGGDVADPLFMQNWRGTAQAGLARGAYHFYYFCRTPEEQAAWFIAHVPRERGSLPPVLDMEWTVSRNCPGRPAPAVVRDHANRFMDVLERHYGTRPIIYTTPDFYEDNDLGRLRAEFWLRSVAGHPSERYPQERWTFWQWTGTGIVPGVQGDTDINAFAGSAGRYRSWMASRMVK